MESENEHRNDTDNLVLFRTLHGYPITPVSLITAVLTLMVAIATIILNAVVLHAIRITKKSGTSTNIFIKNMAAADLLVGFAMIYTVTNNIVHYQIFEECIFRNNIVYTLLIASSMCCVGLTVDRYCSIIFPLKYRAVNKDKFWIACVVIWVFAAVLAFAPLYLVTLAERPKSYLQCGFFLVLSRWYLGAGVTVTYLAPCAILFTLYAHIYIVIWRQVRKRRSIVLQTSIHGKPESSLISPETRKFTKTVLIIIVLYFVCWLPAVIVLLLVISGYFDDVSYVEQGDYLQNTAWLGFFNSLMNPVVYAVNMDHIKKHFCRLLCCCRRSIRETKDRRLGSEMGQQSVNGANLPI